MEWSGRAPALLAMEAGKGALQADGEYEVRVYGLKHQKVKRCIDHFAGLDVSVKETSVCVVDDTCSTAGDLSDRISLRGRRATRW